MKLLSVLALSLSATGVAVAQCPTESVPEPASDPDGFGTSFSMPDGRALVGASGTGGPYTPRGAAFLCEYTPAGFQVTEEFESPNPSSGSLFGANVDLLGDQALISAHGEGTGRVYVFERQGSDWAFRQELTGSDSSAGDGFGVGVDVDGDRAVISAWNSGATGAAYIFEQGPDGAWSEVAKLTPGGPHEARVFGIDVAISGDRVLVGAWESGMTLPGTGAAYVYANGANGWSQVDRLVGQDSQVGDIFGYALELDGDTAVVTAAAHDAGPTTGATYVFEHDGSDWTEAAKFAAPVSSSATYGYSPAIGDGRIAVGASDNDPFVKTTTNYVHLLRRVAGAWVDDGRIPGKKGTGFGNAVKFVDGGLAIGISKPYASAPGDERIQLYSLREGVSLVGGAGESSLAAGASQSMLIAACPDLAGTGYLVLGSLSGTSPTPFGGVSVPLAFDRYTRVTMAQSAVTLTNGIGALDAQGRAQVDFGLPPTSSPALVGLMIHHAALLLNPDREPSAVSGAVGLTLLP